MLSGSLPVSGVPMSARTCAERVPAKQLRGDLDAIAAKALSAEPAERYPDVASLLADVRYFRGDVPVSARAQMGWSYRSGKFIRRHWLGFAVTAAIIAALSVATVVSTGFWYSAEKARAQADRRFFEVRDLAHFMLFDLYDRLAKAPGTVDARARVAATAGHYLDLLRSVPNAPADLRLDSAKGYRRLAEVQGVSGTASLGKPSEAARSLAIAEGILQQLVAENPRSAGALEELGWIASAKWSLQGETADSVAINRAARGYFDAALVLEPGRIGAAIGRIETEKSEAYDLIKGADKPKEAQPILRGALHRLAALNVPGEWQEQAAVLKYLLYSKLGDAVYYGGEEVAALPHYQAALAIAEAEIAAHGESPGWLSRKGEALWNISGTLEEIPGRQGEALADVEQGVSSLRRVLQFGADANAEKKLSILLNQQGMLMSDMGQRQAGIVPMEESIAIRRRRLESEPGDPARQRDLAIASVSFAGALQLAGSTPRACAAAREAVSLWQRIKAGGQLSIHDAKRNAPEAAAAVAAMCYTNLY